MRKKITTTYVLIAMAVLLAFGNKLTAKAAEQAVFRVQTAEVQGDGTIKVSVYLTDTTQLGGVDAELAYDPAKVSCVSSGLGEAFKDGYGETHCDESKSIIKCVTVYPEAKTAQGELMYAVFRLNEGEAYQPELRVIDLVDASKEIQSIPYSVTYQQADGQWAETQDVSGQKAEDSVVRETRNLYGGEADTVNETDSAKDERKKGTEKDEISKNKEAESEEGKISTKEENKKDAEVKRDSKKSNRETILPFAILAIAGIAILALAVLVLRNRRGRGKGEP